MQLAKGSTITNPAAKTVDGKKVNSVTFLRLNNNPMKGLKKQ